MFRPITILAVLVLLSSSFLFAADRADESEDAVAPSSETEVAAEITAEVLSCSESHDDMSALPFEGSSTSKALAARSFGFGGCYTACDPQFNGICPPGQVAELTVTGPTRNCGLGDIRCVDRCVGPVVRCNSFALCN